MPTPINCPTCSKANDFFEEPIGPFCSSRCKRVDLGKWLSEEYRVSEPLSPEHFTEYESVEGARLDEPESES